MYKKGGRGVKKKYEKGMAQTRFSTKTLSYLYKKQVMIAIAINPVSYVLKWMFIYFKFIFL